MKGKNTIIISVGCSALILTMVMFTQFRTVDETDIVAIETMRETELREELASWKSKYEEVEKSLEERENRINEYKVELENDVTSSTLLESEVQEAAAYLGYTKMQGEGIIVTLKDRVTDEGPYEVVHSDLLKLVNELNIADAEAISINDERIISFTDITTVNTNMIMINGNRTPGPYVIRAIGNKKYLESSLTIKGGFIDEMNKLGISVEYVTDDNITIPAFKNQEKQKFEYARENK